MMHCPLCQDASHARSSRYLSAETKNGITSARISIAAALLLLMKPLPGLSLSLVKSYQPHPTLRNFNISFGYKQ